MNNFWRVVRTAMRFRVRYAIAVLFALVGATSYGGNIAALLPVMKLLLKEQTLHQHIADEVASQAKEIQKLQIQIAAIQAGKPAEGGLAGDDSPDAMESVGPADLPALTMKLKRIEWQQKWDLRIKDFVDRYLPQDRFQTLVIMIGVMVAVMCMTFLFEFINEVLVASVTERTMMGLRNRFFRHVMRMEMSGFTQQGTSELMARFTNDMKGVSMGVEVVLGKVVREPLKGITCLVAACVLNWRLTLVALLLVPMAFLVMSVIGNYMKRATKKSLETMSSIYQLLQESFQGVKIVKAFTMEPYERMRFYRETLSYYRKAMRIARLEALSGPVMGIVAMAAVLTAAMAGFYLVVTGKTHIWGIRMAAHPMAPETMGMLFGFLFAASDPVRKISGVYARVQKAVPAADRIMSFMAREHTSNSPLGAPRLPRHAKSIELAAVQFSYSNGRDVLKEINLKVKFGETIALVGPNGCGKSTLVSLLPRFYDAQQGRILIDGTDTRDVQCRSLRRQFGIVTQETILFNDTVYNNIRYGDRRASREQIIAAAKKAYAHRFIEELPQGYDTIVGEKAVKLSGGQRQRIALARAILRDPAILILDEATSALDVESEALIQRVLETFTRDRTTFLITHRLASLQLADRVIVMNEGKIEDQGTHDELLKRCTLYSRLHEIHMSGTYKDAG
jgi:ABC-type multidrug transport system fused ATPase/permease subunit